jgi:hypothetical protein
MCVCSMCVCSTRVWLCVRTCACVCACVRAHPVRVCLTTPRTRMHALTCTCIGALALARADQPRGAGLLFRPLVTKLRCAKGGDSGGHCDGRVCVSDAHADNELAVRVAGWDYPVQTSANCHRKARRAAQPLHLVPRPLSQPTRATERWVWLAGRQLRRHMGTCRRWHAPSPSGGVGGAPPAPRLCAHSPARSFLRRSIPSH